MHAQAKEARLERVAEGIYRFDTGYVRPRHTACFVVVEAGRASIIDCATAASVQPLLAALELEGIRREAVEAVVATHAHLDHTAGIGPLIAELPRARVFAHADTAPHLIDPTRLEQGTRAVLGDEVVDREHAPPVPVDPKRIVETPDGAPVPPGDRLRVVHTPGHARDHQSLWDAATATAIAGDAFGVAYPELDRGRGAFVVPETPPTQFDPKAMHASIDRILALEPIRVVLTHFNVLERPEAAGVALHGMVDEYVARCLDAESVEALERGILAAYEQALSRQGRPEAVELMRKLYGFDAHLVSLGLWHWRAKQQR
ncbi:MAG: MBL fold metallo-hydrolase [Halofilum sp. (in: g-proteobacteria)]